MKILVLTNIKEGTEELDSLDVPNASIIEREVQGSVEQLAEHADRYLKNGKFDCAVVLPDDAMGASMYLNKIDGVRCVICRSGSDVERAKAHDANTIVIEDAQPETINEIIGAMARRGGIGFKLPKLQRQQPAAEIQEKKAVEAQPAQRPAPAQKPMKRVEAKPQPKEEEAPEPAPKGKRNGIGGMLKDYLGIVD